MRIIAGGASLFMTALMDIADASCTSLFTTTSETVLQLFSSVVSEFGLPSRVCRSRCENVNVAKLMLQHPVRGPRI